MEWPLQFPTLLLIELLVLPRRSPNFQRHVFYLIRLKLGYCTFPHAEFQEIGSLLNHLVPLYVCLGPSVSLLLHLGILFILCLWLLFALFYFFVFIIKRVWFKKFPSFGFWGLFLVRFFAWGNVVYKCPVLWQIWRLKALFSKSNHWDHLKS